MPRSPSPLTVLIAGWFVPGGGHLLTGRRTQAIVFFLTVTMTFVAGMALADFRNVSPARHGYYFLAHILNGAETVIASILTSGLRETEYARHFGMRTGEIGALYSAVAGLLNAIVAMDAFGIAAGIRPKGDADEGTSSEKPAREEG